MMKEKKGVSPFFSQEDYNPQTEIETPEDGYKSEMFRKSGIEKQISGRKKEKIYVRVEPAVKARLVSLAEQMDTDYAEIVRVALLEFLEKRGV